MRQSITTLGTASLVALAVLGPASAAAAAGPPLPSHAVRVSSARPMADVGEVAGSDPNAMDMPGLAVTDDTSVGAGSDGMEGMPGMDHDAGAGSGPGSSHQHDLMPGAGGRDAAAPADSRSRTAVLAIFAGFNALVLIAAARLRRRTAPGTARKRTARAAGLRATGTVAGRSL